MPEPNSKKAIEQINSVRTRAVTVPRCPPAAGRRSICNASLQVVTSYSAVNPPVIVMDGLASTLYVCLKDRLLWIHEVGGIAGIDSWLGPVPAEAHELEGITSPPLEGQGKSGSPGG